MQTPTRTYTADEVFRALGYPNPMAAAQQQARMMLLGRLAHYQTEVQRLQAKWHCSLDDLRARYTAIGVEDSEADDDYGQWQWYADAIETVHAQLAVVATA